MKPAKVKFSEDDWQPPIYNVWSFGLKPSSNRPLFQTNSIHRNKVAHCNEMVSVRREWWDDEVFEQYPTWEDALDDSCNYFGKRTGKNPSPILTKYFGEEPSGQGNYARCAKYGIGREVLSKMLSETKSYILYLTDIDRDSDENIGLFFVLPAGARLYANKRRSPIIRGIDLCCIAIPSFFHPAPCCSAISPW